MQDTNGWETRPRRKRRGKRAQSFRKKDNPAVNAPSTAKSQEERAQVLAVAATFRHKRVIQDTSDPGSESEDASVTDSLGSVAIGPVVTPQTADLL